MANYTGSVGVTGYPQTIGNTGNNISSNAYSIGQQGANFTHVFIPATAFDTAGTSWTVMSSLAIPGPGYWRVWCNLRIRWGANSYGIGSNLSSANSAGSNFIPTTSGATGSTGTTNGRWIIERVSDSTFGNINISPEWIVAMPTGLTYPYTIYLQMYAQSADSYNLIQNDSNGQSTFAAYCINGYGPTGSTIYSF